MVHVIRPQPPAQPSAKLQVRPDLLQTLLFRHAFLTAFLGVLSFLGRSCPSHRTSVMVAKSIAELLLALSAQHLLLTAGSHGLVMGHAGNSTASGELCTGGRVC